MLNFVPPVVEELERNSKPNASPTRVLYDTHGVTRTFLVNGVEALRTIPPFYYVNDQNNREPQAEVPVEALPTIAEVPEAAEQLDYETSWSEEEEPEYVGSVLVALSDAFSDSSSDSSSSYSASSRSSSLCLSDIEMSDDGDADEPQPRTSSRVASPGPSEPSANRVPSLAPAEESLPTPHSTPVRATLSIRWSPNERPASNVVYKTPVSRSPSPVIPPRPKTKSPSSLPSLTPSPPPAARKTTHRKRASPSNTRQVCVLWWSRSGLASLIS